MKDTFGPGFVDKALAKITKQLQRGRAVRSARQFHTLVVDGSNPSPATRKETMSKDPLGQVPKRRLRKEPNLFNKRPGGYLPGKNPPLGVKRVYGPQAKELWRTGRNIALSWMSRWSKGKY